MSLKDALHDMKFWDNANYKLRNQGDSARVKKARVENQKQLDKAMAKYESQRARAKKYGRGRGK